MTSSRLGILVIIMLFAQASVAQHYGITPSLLSALESHINLTLRGPPIINRIERFGRAVNPSGATESQVLELVGREGGAVVISTDGSHGAIRSVEADANGTYVYQQIALAPSAKPAHHIYAYPYEIHSLRGRSRRGYTVRHEYSASPGAHFLDQFYDVTEVHGQKLRSVISEHRRTPSFETFVSVEGLEDRICEYNLYNLSDKSDLAGTIELPSDVPGKIVGARVVEESQSVVIQIATSVDSVSEYHYKIVPNLGSAGENSNGELKNIVRLDADGVRQLNLAVHQEIVERRARTCLNALLINIHSGNETID